MVAKMKRPEKFIGGGGGGGGAAGGGAAAAAKSRTTSPISSGSFGRPSWLLFTIADLDERMKMLKSHASEEENASSFAGRADGYYQKRPQLLALLHDLYNGYVSLGDRYCQALAKNQHRRRYSSPISPFHFNEEEECGEVVESDVESSLSYQTPFPVQERLDADILVADLVMKSVNYEIVLNELDIVDKRWSDSSRKIELQQSLLDVLESERLIMLNENASLAFRVNALLEENKGLASESVYMKREVAELARSVLQTREDHRVCVLNRKIDDLQAQVYLLEKQNKEYYDQLVKHEQEKSKSKSDIKSKDRRGLVIPEHAFSWFGNGRNSAVCMKKGCLPMPMPMPMPTGDGGSKGEKRALKLWNQVKKFDIFMCVPHINSTES